MVSEEKVEGRMKQLEIEAEERAAEDRDLTEALKKKQPSQSKCHAPWIR